MHSEIPKNVPENYCILELKIASHEFLYILEHTTPENISNLDCRRLFQVHLCTTPILTS